MKKTSSLPFVDLFIKPRGVWDAYFKRVFFLCF